MTPSAPTRAPARSRRRSRRDWVPNQHGAWGMLAVPFLLGAAAGGWSPVLLALLVAWYGAYLASYTGLALLGGRRRRPPARPFATYAAVTIVTAGLVVAAVPSVAVFALAFAPLLAVNAWQARQGTERSLLNDLVLVAEATVMAPVAAVVGAGGTAAMTPQDWRAAGVAALLSALFLVGSVLHVKVMIRKRGDRAYRSASAAWHAGALVAATAAVGLPALAYAVLLLRALVLPARGAAGHAPTVRTVGLVELACTVLVVALGMVAVAGVAA